jgi:ribosomal protein S18 acetylase RimI-like enzyme
MQFRTLENTAIETLAAAFNNAFADYEIPLQFAPQALQDKIRNEDIDLSLSVGAFDEDVLAGFIFFGIDTINDVKTAWDGGTGVVAAYRGQQLTQRMFAHMVPMFKGLGVKRALLEVLKNNTGAKRIYEKIGFHTIRELHAYKGHVTKAAPEHKVEVLNNPDMNALSALGDWQPAWQQMNKRVQNFGDMVETVVVKDGDTIAAYAHYNKATKRVYQFATAKQYRRRGMATALFHHIAGDNTIPVMFVNIDGNDKAGNAFLPAIAMPHILSQYEMDMVL